MNEKRVRIHKSGRATLTLARTSPFFRYNGNEFEVLAIRGAGDRAKVTLLIHGKPVTFRLDEVR